MFQIIEIQYVPVPLLLPVAAVEVLSQVQQRGNDPGGSPYRLHHLFRALDAVVLLAFGNRLLGPVPAGGHICLFLLVHLFAADRSQAAKGNISQFFVQSPVGPLPGGLPHRPNLPPVVYQHRLVSQRAVLLPARVDGLTQLDFQLLHLQLHIPKDKLHPRALLDLLQRLLPQLLPACGHPLHGPWVALGELPGLQNHILDPGVGLAAAELLHKGRKILAALLVMPLQHFLHHVRPHQGQLPLVADAESRIDLQTAVMVADQIQTKAVDGGNLRLWNQRPLQPQMLVVRADGQQLVHRRTDPLPHLRSRRVGKGHHQQLVDVEGMLALTDHADDPFHQHRRLAGARRRGYQQIPVAAVDHLLLFLSPFHCHLSRFLSV